MTWSPGFSRWDTCWDSGILPETPDPAEAGTPNPTMSGLKFQTSSGGDAGREPPEGGTTNYQTLIIHCEGCLKR